LVFVVADVGDLVRDDQMVFGIHHRLHVVADHAGAFAVGGHGPCVRIGQRDLMVWRIRDHSLHHLKLPHLTAQRLQMFGQPADAQFRHPILLAVGRIEHPQVSRNAGVHCSIRRRIAPGV